MEKMEEKKIDKKKIVNNIEKEIKKIEDGKNKIFFYVMDTKGVPNGSLSYIYEIAHYLFEKGYNVEMLHSEKDFLGVSSWLGEKYAGLKHKHVENNSVGISPSDVLVIPEIYSSVMYATKDLPCKRVALLQNFGYFTEMTQPGATWHMYGIDECITTSETLKNKILEVFPKTKVHVVRPSINEEFFYDTEEPKKLIVNFISKNPQDANAIIKPFILKYPLMKWVCLRNISQLPKEDYSDALREAAFTVWVDTMTDFGYSAIEAMACGSIVIGKVPETEPEWMLKDGEIRDNGIYFFKNKDAYDILFNVITAYIHNEMPDVISKDAKDTIKYYTRENQGKEAESVFKQLIDDRLKGLKDALTYAKNKN